MHHVKDITDEAYRARLLRRGVDVSDDVIELIGRRARLQQEVDDLRHNAKALAQAVKDSRGAQEARDAAVAHKQTTVAREHELTTVIAALNEHLLAIPNCPADAAPDGGEADAVEVAKWGTQPAINEPRDHVQLLTDTGLLDLTGAASLAGARFSLLRGAGARLERGLANMLMDMHTDHHGYTEMSVPLIVNRETMTGTGQLPKFEEDLCKTALGDREGFLIPTGEVPLTVYAQTLKITTDDLPLAFVAQTPCFRAEAGSHGRDTRGILRQHQFNKVELVRIVDADTALDELEVLRRHAETCLERLGLHYRTIALAAGDLGFSAEYTYDIEVWMPGQQAYREVSSCSSCGTFQARRAGIKARGANGNQLVATLNGSALPLGRTLIAIVEQGQQPDGSIVIPPALAEYTRFRRINADGTTE